SGCPPRCSVDSTGRERHERLGELSCPGPLVELLLPPVCAEDRYATRSTCEGATEELVIRTAGVPKEARTRRIPTTSMCEPRREVGKRRDVVSRVVVMIVSPVGGS